MPNFTEYSFMAALFLIHWLPLLYATWKWPLENLVLSFRSMTTFILSIFSWAIVLFCIFIFTDVRLGSAFAKHAGGWYLIYSVLSVGIIPIVVISAHVLAGRFAGFWIKRCRPKNNSVELD